MEPPECPVCLQPFDGEVTIPRVLACGHSACDSCLTHLPKPPFTRTIRCPACTQLVTYPEHPSALPKNIDLLRISSSLNPKPKPSSISPTLPLLDFIPNLWSHEFFNNWKDWITPHDTISTDESTPVIGSSLVYGKGVNLKVPARCSMKCRMNVSLLKVGSFTGNDENGFRYSYLAKAMWVLFKLGDGALAELELVLRSGLMDRRVCGVCGLWYNEEDGSLYLVCERKRTSLLNVVGLYTEVDLSSFAMMGMELCETVSRLHDVELVTGCVSLSCFGVDHFGHVFLDVNEVLMIGERVREMIRESVSFAQNNSDGKTIASNVISEIHVFPSPELLIQFVQKEGVVDLEFQRSTFSVGYSSDLWSLACVLLCFLVGKPFVEETHDFLCSYLLKLVNVRACDCEGLHVAWLEKVSSLLDKRLDSKYVSMKELLCKCLSLDPGTRPIVNDMWKCMRELIISPNCDVTGSIERETISGSACHCLLLGDLLWSSSKTNKDIRTLKSGDLPLLLRPAPPILKSLSWLDEAKTRCKAALVERGKAAERTAEELEQTAEAVGYGAVKYADLKNNRSTSYTFNFDQMLNDKEGQILLHTDDERKLGLHLLRFAEAVEDACTNLLPNVLCEYLYDLSEKFTSFYSECKVVGSAEETSRLLLCEATAVVMRKCFHLLGITPVYKI